MQVIAPLIVLVGDLHPMSIIIKSICWGGEKRPIFSIRFSKSQNHCSGTKKWKFWYRCIWKIQRFGMAVWKYQKCFFRWSENVYCGIVVISLRAFEIQILGIRRCEKFSNHPIGLVGLKILILWIGASWNKNKSFIRVLKNRVGGWNTFATPGLEELINVSAPSFNRFWGKSSLISTQKCFHFWDHFAYLSEGGKA